MKTTKKILLKYWGILLLTVVMISSCVDYLDKAPEFDISEKDIFSKFITFQGFVEDNYQNIVDLALGVDATTGWNFGDDVHNPNSDGICQYWEKGFTNFWNHKSSPYAGRVGGSYVVDNTNKRKGYWHNGWYGIRNANVALANLDKLVGTREEHDIIEGQSLFFRGYYHFEILRAWGGVPYIDTVYAATDILREPRLSYLETATKIAADLEKAASLLPAAWDETTVGQATLGSNAGRLTKGAAWGYVGMNWLYAASPLMNGVQTGNYVYNEELCKKAAVAFNEVIKLADQGYYGLESWTNYWQVFYTLTGSPLPNSNKEVIFSNPVYMQKRYNLGEQILPAIGGSGNCSAVMANYVDYFGMANGLPINASGSGFNPSKPWDNRDPRFYYNILKDGDRIIQNTNNADTYAQFFVGGRHTLVKSTTVSFAFKKFAHITCNKYDLGWNGNRYYYEVPHLRLAEVYLNYAEAVNEAYGPTGSIHGGLTAVEAVNIVRNRAGVPNVDQRYLGSKADFREVVRQERAVELAFEGHRWNDLRRWYIAHLPQYREKYNLEFDKEHTYFKKVLVLTTVHDQKHYWLPFAVDQVSLYPEFKQNPGW